ncbi:MAG TPA: gamma-glutamyltransferase [Alphaproteobacteria bacterium]|nr:gamma-glutamyltransferase [Alphaproteobacteria bacterium]
MRASILIAMLCALGLTAPAALAQSSDLARPAPEGASGSVFRPAVTAQKHMVVAAHPLAARAGEEILAEGGNAIDAMIATQAVLNLVEPQASGIGGGGFLLHYDAAAKKLTSFDARETAPAAATPDLFLGPDGKPLSFINAVIGGRSVGTPGIVRLMEATHQRYGKLPWPRLFARAIQLAEDGFAVSPRLANAIAEDRAQLTRYPEARSYFFHPDGAPLAAGETLRNPALAETLRAIAENGAAAFYEGDIAKDIVATVQSAAGNPGKLSLEDLAAYQVIEREPVCAAYRRLDVCGMGPPSSGALTIGQILGMLEPFNIAALPVTGIQAAHLFAEASKLAYADRALYIADPAFAKLPLGSLIDPGYLSARTSLIDSTRAMPRGVAGTPPWRDGSLYAPDRSEEIPATSHMSIVDDAGNIVALTTSIEAGFGSRLMTRGFLLNNQLTDFSFVALEDGKWVANRVEPGKRPRSSMSPTIVFGPADEEGQRKPLYALGSAGGARIIPHVAWSLIGLIDWNLRLDQSIALPHIANLNGATELEQDTPIVALADGLRRLGQNVQLREINSGLHALSFADGRIEGAVDPRREGLAAGR